MRPPGWGRSVAASPGAGRPWARGLGTRGAWRTTDAALVTLGATYLLMWAGATLGPWLVLRRLHDRLRGRTTFMVGAGFLAWTVVSVPGIFWATEAMPLHGAGRAAGLVLLGAMLCVPPTLGARWIILTNEKMGEREETST